MPVRRYTLPASTTSEPAKRTARRSMRLVVRCQGHAIAATGCRRVLRGREIETAHLPGFRRVSVCANCLRWYLDYTGQVESLRNPHRYRVMGWAPRDALTEDEAAFLARDQVGEWIGIDVRWAPTPERAVEVALEELRKGGVDLGRYTRFEGRKLHGALE